MRLLRVRLENVRGVDACEVTFAQEGVTVIEAPNESGKTTVMDSVDVLLEFKDTSNAQRVRDLAPVDANVGSTIEVELVSGETHLTCEKTFNKDRGTVLTVHAPQREQLQGAPAHDRLRAILESEVDLNLYRALRFDQGRDLSAVALQDSHVLASRLDAVAGGTGSTDGDGLLDRAIEEYRRYYTASGKDGKALTELDDAVADLELDHDNTRKRLAAIAEEVDELAAIDAELPGLRSHLSEEILPRLAELEQQLASIRTRAEVVATRRAEHDSADRAHAAALRDDEQRRAQAATHAELEEQVETLEQRLAPARARQEQLQQQADERDAQLTSATHAAQSAREERDVAQSLVDLIQARQQHAQLASRSQRVEDIVSQAREAQAALAAISLDAAGLGAIQDASREREIAAARLTGGSPTVRVAAHRSLKLEVDGEPLEVTADAAWDGPVGDRLRLQLADADIEVRAGGSTEVLQQALTLATERLSQRCRDAGVVDLANAQLVAQQRAEHEATLQRRDEELERELQDRTAQELDDDLAAAAARVTALAARLPDGTDEPDNLELARERLEAAKPAAHQADEKVGESRATRDAVREELAAARTQAATDEANLAQLRERAAREAAELDAARSVVSDEGLTKQVAESKEALAQAGGALTAAETELDKLDPDAVEFDARSLGQQRDACQERIRTRGERRAGLRARLDLVGEQGLGERHHHLEQELIRARANQRRVHARAAAAKALHDALTTARDEAYRAYRKPLSDRILEKARLLYRQDVDIQLGDDLAIVSRTLDGATLSWGQLSAGAREQLAILSALAAAELAGTDGVPFVLDDALGYTDSQRLERLGGLLGLVTDAQVIVLTCVAARFQSVGGATVVRLLECRGAKRDG